MKTVENRTLHYCEVPRRCVVLYAGVTRKGKPFKSCSHVNPQACSHCGIYRHAMALITLSVSDNAPSDVLEVKP